jgi:hypothetical protein
VLVGLHHLGIVVGRSGKEDIMLGGEFTGNGNLVKSDLVARFVSFALIPMWAISYKAISRCKSALLA